MKLCWEATGGCSGVMCEGSPYIEVGNAGVRDEGSETELVCSNTVWFQSIQKLHLLEIL